MKCNIILIFVLILVGFFIMKMFESTTVHPIIIKHSDSNHLLKKNNCTTQSIHNNAPIHTRGYTYYTNIGYLSNATGIILPLYGKQTYCGSINWNYYTVHDHSKIPLVLDNKDCMETFGCKELNQNDLIYIDAFRDSFKVYLYKPQLYY